MLIQVHISCSHNKHLSDATTVQQFTIPEIPSILTSVEQKAEYVSIHYWEIFDFSDTTLINHTEITEHAFADFVNILQNISEPIIEKSISTMMEKATIESSMYTYFLDLSEKFLYNPNSPFRNENMYIVVLKNAIINERLDDIYKVRLPLQLNNALKNRIGDSAIDFTYTTNKGRIATLYSLTGDLLLLFFFHLDCEICKGVKEYIKSKQIEEIENYLITN